MEQHRFILEKYTGRNSRYECPNCGKPYQFSKYIDTHTGEVLNTIVGKCNRVDKCGYHYTPKQYFANNEIAINKHQWAEFRLNGWLAGDVSENIINYMLRKGRNNLIYSGI